MKITHNKYKLPILTFIIISIFLSVVQLKVDRPMLLLERFFTGWGWFEIVIIGLYGSVVIYHMQSHEKLAKWRKYTWLLFSVVFFSQLILGLFGFEKFLMTGKLHLPIPAMIVSGPIYRGQISFMTILFVSTVILSGPAWCSQLCYFGALDNAAVKGKMNTRPIKNKIQFKHLFLLIIIAVTITLKWLNVQNIISIIIAGLFGVAGISVIILYSNKRKKMYHCLMYCPIGTIVNYTRYLNPFRMYIDTNCTSCMKCLHHCNYDALNAKDIKKGKPAITCTLCGDCVTSCHTNSIKHKLFRLNPVTSRNIYLVITISIHAIFLALARI